MSADTPPVSSSTSHGPQVSVGPEAGPSPHEDVAAVLNRTTADRSNAVNELQAKMRGENDPGNVFREAKPFRYKDVHKSSSENSNPLQDIDIAISDNLGNLSDTSRLNLTELSAVTAREHISQLLSGEIIDSQLQQELVTVLLEWPTLRELYDNKNNFSQLSDEEQRELLQDVANIVASPKFQEKLVTACEGIDSASKNAKEAKNNLSHAERQILQAEGNLTKAQSDLVELQKIQARIKDFEVDENGEKGAALKELEDNYPLSEFHSDSSRITMGELLIDDLNKKINDLDKENASRDKNKDDNAIKIKENNRLKKDHEKARARTIKEIEALRQKTEKRAALVTEREKLRQRKDALPGDITRAEAEVTTKTTDKETAENAKQTAEKKLQEAQEKFAKTLKEVPELAISDYMDDRLEQLSSAREELLKKYVAEASQQTDKVFFEALLKRWKDPDGKKNVRVRNTVTDAATGKKKKIDGFHYEEKVVKGSAKSDLIKKDFETVCANGNAEGLMMAILLENSGRIPGLTTQIEQAETTARETFLQSHTTALNEEEQASLYQDVRFARTEAIRQWYQSQPEEWRFAHERELLNTLYSERFNNCTEGETLPLPVKREANGKLRVNWQERNIGKKRIPIADYENDKFMKALENVYPGQEEFNKAFAQAETNIQNPKVEEEINKLKTEAANTGESIVDVAKKRKKTGLILGLFFASFLTITEQAGFTGK